MKKLIFSISISIIFPIGICVAEQKCHTDQCNNVSASESQYDIRDREIAADVENLREHGADQRIWSRFRLESDSKLAEDLKMSIIKSIGLEMRLDPKKGYLTIEKKGLKQIFSIGASAGTNNVCPEYDLAIIDASDKHAIIRKYCHLFEYRPNLFYRGVDYFLYDMEAADMRSIWSSETDDRNDGFPKAIPVPKIKKVPSGYIFDWTGISASDPSKKKFSIHAKYVRKLNKQTKKMELLCINPDDPKGEFTGGPCEARGAPTILDQRALGK